MRETVQSVQDGLHYFKKHMIVFCNKTLQQVIREMSPEEQKIFEFDTKKLDWFVEGGKMIYGLQRNYLKQDVPRLESGWRGILQKNHIKMGHDIRFGLMARQII